LRLFVLQDYREAAHQGFSGRKISTEKVGFRILCVTQNVSGP